MSSAKAQATSSGIGFGGLLTLIFVAAKLWHQIDWSWWWVCSPLWISAALGIGLIVIVFAVASLIAGIGSIADALENRKRIKARARK